MIDEEQRRRHAKSSLNLLWLVLGFLGVLVVVLPLIAPLLNGYAFLRFPLGLFLITHGAVAGIIAIVYWAAARQDRLDRRHGLTTEL
jgi:putative solute:sodium symporter small subunit